MPPPALGKNKYSNPQLDNVQRVKDLGTLGTKWDVSVKSLPSQLREPCGTGRKSVRTRGDGGHRENKAEQLMLTGSHRGCGSMHRACTGLGLMGSQG